MDVQQLIALAIVTAAALYLGRGFIVAARRFFSQQAGCGGGCGKCGFAPRGRAVGQTPKMPANVTIIPLKDVRMRTDNRDAFNSVTLSLDSEQ